MKAGGLVYTANGEIRRVVAKNGTDFSLDELREIVHGSAERISLSCNPQLYMVCNENFLSEGLPRNLAASMLYGGLICGDVLVCKREFVK